MTRPERDEAKIEQALAAAYRLQDGRAARVAELQSQIDVEIAAELAEAFAAGARKVELREAVGARSREAFVKRFNRLLEVFVGDGYNSRY